MTIETIQLESAEAWRDYVKAIEDARAQILNETFIRDHPLERARGLYYLQTAVHSAFAFYIAPRQAYPVLYSQAVYMPFEVTWGLSCPDFMYYWAFLDGAHTYRIWGNRGTTRWLNVQLQRGWRGDEVKHSLLGNFDLEDPGIPNWIDASGLSYGTALWRYYLSKQTPVPSVKKVSLASVRQHLPKDTPVITEEARKAQLARRARASLSRYGFAPRVM
ncbi:MAG: hypothetical protein ABI771_13595 [Betaproteobacteria bacterium]